MVDSPISKEDDNKNMSETGQDYAETGQDYAETDQDYAETSNTHTVFNEQTIDDEHKVNEMKAIDNEQDYAEISAENIVTAAEKQEPIQIIKNQEILENGLIKFGQEKVKHNIDYKWRGKQIQISRLYDH